MSREEALSRLSSDVPSERLEAARYLQFWALPGDVPALRSAFSQESVGWIKRAIQSALDRLGDLAEVEIDLNSYIQDEAEQSREASSLARGRLAQTLVHELEPIVGTIQYYAKREIKGDYESSRTREQVDRLARFLRAMETLAQIVAGPHIQRFELRTLLSRLVDAEQSASGHSIRLVGPTVANVLSSPGLIEIVIANALRNATESLQASDVELPRIDVVFDLTDRDFWVSVRDNGRAIPSGSTDRLFDLGTSTKDGHLGMGLALSVEAVRSLKGDIKLLATAEGATLDATFPMGNQ